ncbi:flagellar assembly peptidoglycan hydrolase FlgJ [Oceanospirillaceae bacterium ASx5O]|nr:flagellar assembly peptidoglycan hydrolase FlgJ [Oceanospirillaceae bacterium ASx5O]
MINNNTNVAATYTDINALQGIRKLGKQDQSAALMEVAKQFESMFVNMMMSSMRDASAVFEEDSLFSSPEGDFYQQMYDDQMALSLSNGGGMGLAPVIHRQLMNSYGNVNKDRSELPLDQGKLHDRRISVPIYQPLQQTLEQVDAELARQPGTPQASASETVNSPAAAATIASGNGGKGQQFATPADFVAAVYPHAQTIGAELGVDPRAIVAQAALETGWGKHMITDEQGRNSHNFFGIKADQRWNGESVNVLTHEFRGGVAMKERAAFRSYASLEDGLRDYANFLQSGQRYQNAINNGLDADQYGYELQRAGYATDPQYGAKIQRISRSDTLNDALQQMQQSLLTGARNDG